MTTETTETTTPAPQPPAVPATPAPPEVKLSRAQEYAEERRDAIVPEVKRTVVASKILGWLIVVLVLIVSYEHMRSFFEAREPEGLGPDLLPIIIDLGILFFIGVISTAGMDRLPLRASMVLLAIPLGLSAVVNYHGSKDPVMGWVYVAVIGLVAAVKIIVALIKPDPRKLQEQEESIVIVAVETAKVVDEAKRLKRQESARKGKETLAKRLEREQKARDDAAERRRSRKGQPGTGRSRAGKPVPVSPTVDGLYQGSSLVLPTTREVATFVG